MLARQVLAVLCVALVATVAGAQEVAPMEAAVANPTTSPPPSCPNTLKQTIARGPTIKTLKDTVDLRARCCRECTATPACIAYTHTAAWMGNAPMQYVCELKSGVDRFVDMSGVMDVFFETTIVPKRS